MGKPFPFRNALSLHDTILGTVGAAPEHINSVGVTRFSTSTQPSNTDGWVIPSGDGVFRFGCWRQGVTGWWTEAGHTSRQHAAIAPQPSRTTAAIETERTEFARLNAAAWDRAYPLKDASPAGRYLLNRGLALAGYPAALRMASTTYYDDGIDCGKHPTMLGVVSDHQGAMVALHRTYLTIDGHKAPVAKPKKLTRTSAPISGASIKLYPPQIINGKLTLGVAEGIETALACLLGSGIPTWSCVSAGGMKSFIWPAQLESLIIFADHDIGGVGQAAAHALAARAATAGLEVRVLVPTTAGADWLDVYTGEAE
jgi:putative DNA primase/helicase